MLKLNLSIRLLICLSFVFIPLHSLDKWFYDQYFRLRGKKKQETEIVLIRISDAKLFQLLEKESTTLPPSTLSIEQGNVSLWHRPFYEELLRKIGAEKPKLVVFTQFYDWIDHRNPTPLPIDNIIFASIINDENRPIAPSKLTQKENFGFNNLFPDLDNTIRQARLYYSYGASLALTSYRALNKAFKNSGEQEFSQDLANLLEPISIDFRGPLGTYPSFNGWDIFSSEQNTPARFKDKIVLIGREGSPSSDVETPFGRMSRLEVQANIIDTFLNHQNIQPIGKIYVRIFSLVAVILSGIIVIFFPLTLAWLLLLLLSTILGTGILFTFSELKLWMGIANPLFGILGTHLVLLGYKLRRQEEAQWRAEQETVYLRELDQFKNNFISLFSHDLKTPIAKIKAIVQRTLTEHKELPTVVSDALRGIDKTSGELARLISDILKVTRLESTNLELSKEVIDMNRLVESVVNELKFLAEEKNIPLVTDLEPLFSIEGDQKLIREVITNLVENAIKYSFKDKQIIIRTHEIEGEVRVSVIDEGMGISPEDIPRVTGKFYRAESISEEIKGSGLGLYLANYFVELHKGKLSIKSEVGRGTEVTFSVPIQS